MWLSGLRTQHCLCEDAVSIPSLAQWVKDRCCCGCGIGCSCSSDSTPGLGTAICCRCSRKKKNKTKQKNPAQNRAPPCISATFSFSWMLATALNWPCCFCPGFLSNLHTEAKENQSFGPYAGHQWRPITQRKDLAWPPAELAPDRPLRQLLPSFPTYRPFYSQPPSVVRTSHALASPAVPSF